MSSHNRNRMSPLRMSLILAVTLASVSCFVYVATFGHASESAGRMCAVGGAWTAVATIAPIWLESWIINGATFQLAVITWRLLTMLGAFIIVQTFPPDSRKYFLTTLMACYFIALPLESWLLARNASKR